MTKRVTFSRYDKGFEELLETADAGGFFTVGWAATVAVVLALCLVEEVSLF